MNVDRILSVLNSAGVDYILIGGVNFLLRHGGPITYDVDTWVRDKDENLSKLVAALKQLGAEWGQSDAASGPIREDTNWLDSQSVLCLLTREGGLGISREVPGLEGTYAECKKRARPAVTGSGIPYLGLSDDDMLQTKLALETSDQKPERIAVLKKAAGS